MKYEEYQILPSIRVELNLEDQEVKVYLTDYHYFGETNLLYTCGFGDLGELSVLNIEQLSDKARFILKKLQDNPDHDFMGVK